MRYIVTVIIYMVLSDIDYIKTYIGLPVRCMQAGTHANISYADIFFAGKGGIIQYLSMHHM